MPPEGVSGTPHGLPSSTDEGIAFAIGIVALLVTVFYDGDLDVRPVSVAERPSVTTVESAPALSRPAP